MDTSIDLSLEFNSQLGDTDYGHDMLAFEQHRDQEPDRNTTTIEMVDQSLETGLEPMNGVGEGDMELLEPHTGMEFDSLESARSFYFKYADHLGFRVRASRFRTSRRDDSIIMRRFVCYKEGFYLKNEKKKNASKERRKRGSLREGCKAMFEVIRKDQDKWVVAKLVTEHTHPFSNTIKVRKPKKKTAVPAFPVNVRPVYGEGVGDHGRDHIFRWGGGEAFNLLEYFKKMQTKNPAFFYSIQIDENKNSITNVLWADARARMAYSYFGDAVALDTTYKKSRHMVPFVTFTGTNHHLQPTVFACAVLSNETEASLVWLFNTFLTAMSNHHPISFVTEKTEALGTAVAKVFPHSRHRYCKWWILSKCKENLPNVCSITESWHSIKGELKKCIDESETVEEFELSWDIILQKHNLKEDLWLLSLYCIRQQWVTLYLRDTFFAEMSPSQRSESMKKFFQRSFETKTTIRDFVEKFDQAMMGQFEKEVQSDLANLYTRPVMKTGLQIEKQAAEIYTKTIFSIFQEELVQSSCYSYSVDKCEDGINWTYHVVLDGSSAGRTYTVIFNYPEKRASCSCHKFEFSGILCRHVLRVFSGLQVSNLPEEYFLKRWKQNAKSGPVLFESSFEFQSSIQKNLTIRCNDLCLDVLKYAAEGATSSVMHNAAKDALQKAYAEVLAAKKLHVPEPGR